MIGPVLEDPLLKRNKTKHVLVIHSSAGLYGADRSLYDLLVGIRKQDITFSVCLPEEGPLADKLRQQNINVYILPLVKVSRKNFSIWGSCILFIEILRSLYCLERVTRGEKIDLVYTNTIAVLGGALWAFIKRKSHVWHVREVIEDPPIVSRLYQYLVYKLSKVVICNSQATSTWITKDNHELNSCVIWNGVDVGGGPPNEVQKRVAKQNLGLDELEPVVLFVGRFNAWKGPELLVDAANESFSSGWKRYNLLFVGGPPPGQDRFLTNLQSKVASSPLAAHIRIDSFSEDIVNYYLAADILIVPSLKPEPFGRVAIEGMAYGVPVIAANHGGLQEIVVNGVTGLLVEPGSSSLFAGAINKLLLEPELRCQMGKNGHKRQGEMFTVEAYRAGIISIFYSLFRDTK